MRATIATRDGFQRRSAAGIAIAGAIVLALVTSAPATAGESANRCPGPQIRTATGCTAPAAAGRHVREIVQQAVEANDLRAALLRVDIGDRTLATASPGESMAGVPANLRMHFRIGSMAIPYLIDLLLQLQDRGQLSLDDPVSNWFPDLPNADRVTLRMMANDTSGYRDWIQGNPAFVDALFADPFRQWKTQELLDVAFARGLACEPGACFNYAHTNYAILAKVVAAVTGKSTQKLMYRRVLNPLGLRQTRISGLPAMPEPVLHTYTSDRGPYEDSTFWSASWTVGRSTIASSTIGDVVKSARAMGTGALLSAQASRERFAPITATYPGFTPDLYFGLGVVVVNTWQLQNPDLNGYTGIMAYLPSRRISVGLAVTRGQTAAATDTNYSQLLFAEITEYLSPNHPGVLPG